MRIVKGLALLVALASTAALVFAGVAQPRRVTRIDLLDAGMNFAFVRVAGVVVSVAPPTSDDAFLSFLVQDAVGRVRVTAYRQTRRALRDSGRAPQAGDRVVIDGTLRIRDDEPMLLLNSAADLTLTRPEPIEIRLAAVDALAVGDRAMTLGQLRRLRKLRDGQWLLTLRDGSALIDVPLNTRVEPRYVLGDWLRVIGAVGDYRDARQLTPHSTDDVTVIAPPERAARPIAALNADLIGEWVRLDGDVVELRAFKNGMRLALQGDDGDLIDVIVFDSAWQRVPFSTTLQAGDRLSVDGAVGEYRGQLQVAIELPGDLRALTSTPSDQSR
jgi:DNA/RNA endonuclease YhcR with UshA esterase domain